MALQWILIFTALYVLPALPVQVADKRQYRLTNPTPDELLRDLTTDRPDLTESPMTIDAGRLQFEINALGYTRSQPDDEGVAIDSFDYAVTNIRIGVTHNSELNLVWQPYGHARTRPSGGMASSREDGIGGLDIRGKLNLFGNDVFENPGDTALALLPFVSLPTDRNNGISPEDIEGGIIVPVAVALPMGFGLGLNGGVTATKDEEGSGYHAEAIASAALSREWSDRLGSYYEIATVLGTDDPRGDVLLLGTGFTYAVTDNVQLDGGINFGVTSASDRINPFVGLTWRR